jgi:endonuclease/exonuclease/phosphatase family metal-dependent hydrolase
MTRLQSSRRLALCIVLLISCCHLPDNRTKAAKSERAELFTYDELIQLYEQDTLNPQLQQKLDHLRTTPIVSNEASAHGVRPVKPESEKLGKVLRVASWNIEEGLEFTAVSAALTGPDKLTTFFEGTKLTDKEREEALQQAALLKQADVIVLNEVDWGMKRTGYRNVAAELASALEMNYAWGLEFVEVDPLATGTESFKEAKPEDVKRFKERTAVDPTRYLGLHGNAILSRYQLDNVRLVPLKFEAYDWYGREKARVSPVQAGKDRAGEEIFLEKAARQVRRGGRNMLLADISDPDIPQGKATIVATHLEDKTAPKGRQSELQEVLAQIHDFTNPVILAGDMNTSTYDRTPTSLSRELKKRFGSAEFWLKETINFATGAGLIRAAGETVTRFARTYSDPTVANVPLISENHEAKFFELVKKSRLTGGGSFDFRGEKDRSADNHTGTLANSNERATKGFVATSEVPRPIGPVGKFKLDWIFVVPSPSSGSASDGGSHRFAPHFGRTLDSLNKVIPDRISDHDPIIVDLPFSEPNIP